MNKYTKMVAKDVEWLLDPEKREERKRKKEFEDIDKERLDDYGLDEKPEC